MIYMWAYLWINDASIRTCLKSECTYNPRERRTGSTYDRNLVTDRNIVIRHTAHTELTLYIIATDKTT